MAKEYDGPVPVCSCHGLPKKRINKGKSGYGWKCRVKQKSQERGRPVHAERIGTAPEEQPYNPIGTGAGTVTRKKQEYIPPPVPKRPMPDHVPEIRPLYHTFGQWTEPDPLDPYRLMAVDELVPPKGSPEGVYFDSDAADHACDKIETLYQFEGRWAGHRISLTYFERRLIRYIFGWKRSDGTRLIRKLYLEIPRKNGKTVLAACIAIYLTYWDEEASPQVYFAA